MSYLSKNRVWAGMLLLVSLFYNLYYLFLVKIPNAEYLLYLDVLLAVLVFLAAGVDASLYYKKKREKETLLRCSHVIYRELSDGGNDEADFDIAEHDVRILEQQLQEQFQANCQLQDYIAKCFHEVKLPLSAVLLMNEKIEDAALRTAQKQQLEKIRQQLNGVLCGCRVHSSLFDLKMREKDLAQCVKKSVHNNQYFLIQSGFELIIKIPPLSVYTDSSWLVYVLDQLIQNSIKYASEKPVLRIEGAKQKDRVSLRIWDNGQGIQACDIRRIFERGYTGSCACNGNYKSTGMGLYLAAQIIERLGHTITVESAYGEYTEFEICFFFCCKDKRISI